jgi:hypothetical protein
MNSLFGVEHQLDVGVIDPIEDDVVELTLSRGFGGLPPGTALTFRADGSANSRAFLPVIPAGAEVIAADAHGRPALLLRRVGDGNIILCTYPIEHMAAVTPRVNPDATVALYDALASHAGVRRPITVDDPRVTCDMLVRDDGARFAVLASHAAEPLDLKPVLGEPGSLTTLSGLDAGGTVAIEPFGVALLAVSRGSGGACR